MKAGDTVRSIPGYERNLLPGYEGEVLVKDGSAITVRIRIMPDQMGGANTDDGRYRLPAATNMVLHSLAHKWKVVKDDE